MADTKLRSWRLRAPGATIERTHHTREVRSESLPPRIAQALLEMAKQLDEAKAEIAAQRRSHADLVEHFRTVGRLFLGRER